MYIYIQPSIYQLSIRPNNRRSARKITGMHKINKFISISLSLSLSPLSPYFSLFFITYIPSLSHSYAFNNDVCVCVHESVPCPCT